MRHRRSTPVKSAEPTMEAAGVQLHLVCEDEELSPAQTNDYQMKMKKHNDVRGQVRILQQQMANIVYLPAGAVPPQTSLQPLSNGAHKVISLDSDDDDDLIILDGAPNRNSAPAPEPGPSPAPALAPAPEPGPSPVSTPVAGAPLLHSQVVGPPSSGPPQIVYTPNGLPIVLPEPGQHTFLTAAQATQLLQMQTNKQQNPVSQRSIGSMQQLPGKRPRSGSTENSKNKRSRKQKEGSGNGNGNGGWVPLDEYYYGKKEGDPAYREEKGEFRFKCWYCHKMLYNNIRLMQHMQGHIDSEKQHNIDLADLTQCPKCYKTFDTPFEQQCHMEKVHQKNSNVLLCRVCEKDHESQSALRHHMKTFHKACEMPYICQLCNFRSSIYNDVVDHFKKRHDSSQNVMCLFCMRVLKISFSKVAGWGQTLAFYSHLQKHNSKAIKRCHSCKLNFVNQSELKLHKNKDHLPNYRVANVIGGSGNRTVNSEQQQVMIQLPAQEVGSGSGSSKIKSLNAPQSGRTQEFGVQWPKLPLPSAACKECGHKMATQGHFRKFMTCSLCRFATGCTNAFSDHMLSFHSGKQRRTPSQPTLQQPWFCLCGFSSDVGNRIANHLVACSKRTSYMNRPEQKWFEYDDEHEEYNPEEPYVEETEQDAAESQESDVPALFGMLGLVKKRPSNSAPKEHSRAVTPASPTEAAEEAVETVLDVRKSNKTPVKIPAPRAIPDPLPSVQEPRTSPLPLEFKELKGKRSRDTVRITDPLKPSKSSSLGKDQSSQVVASSSETNQASLIESEQLSPETHSPSPSVHHQQEASSSTPTKENEFQEENSSRGSNQSEGASLERNEEMDRTDVGECSGLDMEQEEQGEQFMKRNNASDVVDTISSLVAHSTQDMNSALEEAKQSCSNDQSDCQDNTGDASEWPEELGSQEEFEKLIENDTPLVTEEIKSHSQDAAEQDLTNTNSDSSKLQETSNGGTTENEQIEKGTESDTAIDNTTQEKELSVEGQTAISESEDNEGKDNTDESAINETTTNSISDECAINQSTSKDNDECAIEKTTSKDNDEFAIDETTSKHNDESAIDETTSKHNDESAIETTSKGNNECAIEKTTSKDNVDESAIDETASKDNVDESAIDETASKDNDNESAIDETTSKDNNECAIEETTTKDNVDESGMDETTSKDNDECAIEETTSKENDDESAIDEDNDECAIEETTSKDNDEFAIDKTTTKDSVHESANDNSANETSSAGGEGESAVSLEDNENVPSEESSEKMDINLNDNENTHNDEETDKAETVTVQEKKEEVSASEENESVSVSAIEQRMDTSDETKNNMEESIGDSVTEVTQSAAVFQPESEQYPESNINTESQKDVQLSATDSKGLDENELTTKIQSHDEVSAGEIKKSQQSSQSESSEKESNKVEPDNKEILPTKPEPNREQSPHKKEHSSQSSRQGRKSDDYSSGRDSSRSDHSKDHRSSRDHYRDRSSDHRDRRNYDDRRDKHHSNDYNHDRDRHRDRDRERDRERNRDRDRDRHRDHRNDRHNRDRYPRDDDYNRHRGYRDGGGGYRR